MANYCCQAQSVGRLLLLVFVMTLLASKATATCVGNPLPVTNNVWRCGASTADGAVCNGTCNIGYTSIPGPTATCNNGVWGTAVGACTRVCAGKPPADLLDANAMWPDSCDTKTPFLGRCTATCLNGATGAPSIMCGGSNWDRTSFRGRCVVGPVCLGSPSARVTNGRLPPSCADMPAGSNCTATCNSGYGGPSPVTVACVADGTSPSGASWSPTAAGTCVKVCTDTPPADLLEGAGTWPASCTGQMGVGQRCQAVCGGYGSASIQCGNGGWVRGSFMGRCSATPVCTGTPTAPLLNGRFPTSCAGTAANGSCTGVCNTGYGGPTSPTVACMTDTGSPSGASWAASANGSCVKVCTGAPPASLLLDGTWPDSCTDKTPVNGVCTAACNNFGAASIRCGSGSWSVSTFQGQCKTTPVCTGPLPTIINGRFPPSCNGLSGGQDCTATCNAGYEGAAAPVTTCQVDPGTQVAAWSTPDPTACIRGTVQNGTAFIITDEGNAVVICNLRFGQFYDCVASQAAVGNTAEEPLHNPLGIAVSGRYLWISDTTPSNTARVRVCTWEGQMITACNSTTLGLRGAGQVAVDISRNLLYHILNDQSCVMVCTDIYTLSTTCKCYTTPELSETSSFPFGIAVGFDHIWVASMLGILKCPQTADGFDYYACNVTMPTVTATGDPFVPSSVLVDTAGAGSVYMADWSSSVMICNVNMTKCVASSGNGTFVNNGPGQYGLAVAGGYLYVPLQVPTSPALSVCSKPSTASGCRFTLWTTNPPLTVTSAVSVAVVPPPGPNSTAAALVVSQSQVTHGRRMLLRWVSP